MFCLTLEHNETCEAILFYKIMEKETKLCSSCLENKPINSFRKNSGLSSYRSQCNQCLKNGVKVPKKDKSDDGCKICKRCNIKKEFKEFPKNRNNYGEGGVQNICKNCRKLNKSKKSISRVCVICKEDKRNSSFKKADDACKKCRFREESLKLTTLVCTICNQEKELHFFTKSNDKTLGYRKQCKNCKNKQYREKVGSLEKEVYSEGYKRCSVCKILKEEVDFTKDRGKLRAECKECKKEYNKRSKNLINKTTRLYNKNRLEKDNLFKLKTKLRGSINTSFKNKNYIKSLKTLEILGCTFEEFKKYIESQFENWMSWDNYGNSCETLKPNCSWDLDHIIPLSKAKTEEELYLLNHWSNFQPLCSYVNRYIKRDNVYAVTNLELKITIL